MRLQLTYNQGAFLSLGSSLPDGLRRSIFTVGKFLLLIGALIFALFSRSGTFSVVLAAALFIAGGIDNLMDRIFHGGTVVDFLNVGVGPPRTGIFNVADVAIMGGALVLIFFVYRKQQAAEEPPQINK